MGRSPWQLGSEPLSPTTEKQTLAGDCVLQVTQPPSDDSTNVNSGSRASADAASASSTEPKDATSTLPIGILSRDSLNSPSSRSWCGTGNSGIVAWNRGCEQLYGYSRSESLGRTSHQLLQTRFPQPFAEIEQAIGQRGTWSGELRHLTRVGSEIIVESRWQLTRISERKLLLETNRDITERKAAQEALRRADHQKDVFLAMLAHELRDPLAPIHDVAVLLTRAVGSDPGLGALTAMITRQSQHLTRLSTLTFSNVSQIARSRIILQSEPLGGR